MSYRPDRERQGFCRVFYRDGTSRVLKRNEYEPITAALQAGAVQWYEAEDLFGDQVLIRLAAVIDVADASPAGVAAFDAEEDKRRAHERTDDEDY